MGASWNLSKSKKVSPRCVAGKLNPATGKKDFNNGVTNFHD